MLSLCVKIRPAIPSQQGCALLCASAEASAERASHDGEADPVSAALTGPPRMLSGIEARSTMARTGVERSWSRHTDLIAAKSDERIIEDVKLRRHSPADKTWGLQGNIISVKTLNDCSEIYRLTYASQIEKGEKESIENSNGALTETGCSQSYSK